jgi:hypothetical protein
MKISFVSGLEEVQPVIKEIDAKAARAIRK